MLHVTCVSSVSEEADNCLDGPLPWTPLLNLLGDDSCFIRMMMLFSVEEFSREDEVKTDGYLLRTLH